MKTVMIYEQFTMPLEFIVLDGDYSHLNKIFINDADDDEELQAELSQLLYDDETGKAKLDASTFEEFPVQEVKDGAIVIVCGFLP